MVTFFVRVGIIMWVMSYLSRTFGFVACLFLFNSVCAGLARAETSSTALAPLILRTSDGRFLDIRSGVSAATEDELFARLAGDLLEPESPPSPPSASEVSPFPVGSSLNPPSAVFLQGIPAPRPILAIRRARALLEARVIAPQTLKQKPPEWRVVELALWNTETDDVRLVTVEKNGSSLRAVPLDLQIRVRGGSGYDTDYAVTPSTNVVVGVRYPIVESVVEKKKTVYKTHDMVYVPYTVSLHTPEVINWGKVVLDQLVKNALDDMRSKRIASRAFPGQLLADAADPIALKSIMAIEHMDHASVRTGADDRLDLFYVELALNEEHAFHTAVSSAGANGLLQFIPSTYASIVKNWPQLGLIKDFETGMGDLPNAIKAGMAYLDGVWSDLPAQAKDSRVTSPEAMRAYLIAAYNTGGIRVRRAITKFGDAWDQNYRADWEKLDAKQTDLAISINRLKKSIKAEKQAAKKKKLQAQLATTQAQHAQVTQQLESLDRSRLKLETLGYLQKYRLIAPRMKQPVQVASAL